MANDKQILIDMLKRACVVFTVYDAEEGILICVDDQPEVIRRGYRGFASEFFFKPDGSLLTVGAAE